jgi:prepilin-type N-terminal cleavage/methylation domain-containing protein
MRVKKDQGFSLVELVITVTIIGIVATIAVPSMMGVLPRIRLGNRATTLANEIAATRMQAIAKSNEFRVVLNPGAETYRLEKLVGASWTPYGTTQLGETDLVSANGFDVANTLSLSPNGAASVPLGSQAVILLQTPPVAPATEGDYQRRLLVEATGRVIVQKRTIGGAWTND